MRLRSKHRIENTIPVASMADIAFLLITFFMLTSTFARDTGIDISLPKAATTQELPEKEVQIWITKANEIYLNRELVSEAQLPNALRDALQKTSLKAVTIRGDEDVSYGKIVAVLDVANLQNIAVTFAAVQDEAVAKVRTPD